MYAPAHAAPSACDTAGTRWHPRAAACGKAPGRPQPLTEGAWMLGVAVHRFNAEFTLPEPLVRLREVADRPPRGSRRSARR